MIELVIEDGFRACYLCIVCLLSRFGWFRVWSFMDVEPFVNVSGVRKEAARSDARDKGVVHLRW